MIPLTATLHVRWDSAHSGKSRRLRLWIPMVLVWLFLAPLLLLALPLLAVVGLYFRVNALRAYGVFWEIACATRHTLVEVHSPRADVRVRLG